MERAGHVRCKVGFTLIELLVASSVTALMIALVLPALGMARSSVMTIVCGSNQGQMLRGWSVAMINNNDQIPRTISFYDPISKPWDDWTDILYKTMGSVGDNTFTGFKRTGMMACPHIESQFSGPIYESHHYGYAVNSRMKMGQLFGDNEGVKWSLIKFPSAYPWFSDPSITVNGVAGSGKRYFGAVSSSDWGIGFYHGHDSGSVAYADGHVTAITKSVLAGPSDNSASPESVPLWLLDTP